MFDLSDHLRTCGMMMTGSVVQHIRTGCVLPAALGTKRNCNNAMSLSVYYVARVEDVMLASRRHKIREQCLLAKAYTAQVNNKHEEKHRPAAYLICQMSLVDEEAYHHSSQWYILLIQSYLTCPSHARFVTLLKHPGKASLGPCSPCIIHVECLPLHTRWVPRSFSSEPWPRRAGCPAG